MRTPLGGRRTSPRGGWTLPLGYKSVLHPTWQSGKKVLFRGASFFPDMLQSKHNRSLSWGRPFSASVACATTCNRQLLCFLSSAGWLRTHSIAWGWQAMPIFEHVIFPASRWQVTQRSVHSAHPGGCAWAAGWFGGTGNLAGASGTISADGKVWPAAQFAHAGGASAARPASVVMSTAITNAPRHAQALRTGNESSIMIVSLHPK